MFCSTSFLIFEKIWIFASCSDRVLIRFAFSFVTSRSRPSTKYGARLTPIENRKGI